MEIEGILLFLGDVALEYYALLLKKLKWIRLYQELDQYRKNVGGARLRNLPMIARIGFPIH